MVPFFDVGDDAKGVIAIGQFATGVVAIGQMATGVFVLGQFARGVFCIGQFAIGFYAVGMFAAGLVSGAGAGLAPRFYGAGLSLLPGTPARLRLPTLHRLGEIAKGAVAWVRVRAQATGDALQLSENGQVIPAYIHGPLMRDARSRIDQSGRDVLAEIAREHDGTFTVQRMMETGEDPTAPGKRRTHWILGGGLYLVLLVVYFFVVVQPVGELLLDILAG